VLCGGRAEVVEELDEKQKRCKVLLWEGGREVIRKRGRQVKRDESEQNRMVNH
jgi:hypothetical protein